MLQRFALISLVVLISGCAVPRPEYIPEQDEKFIYCRCLGIESPNKLVVMLMSDDEGPLAPEEEEDVDAMEREEEDGDVKQESKSAGIILKLSMLGVNPPTDRKNWIYRRSMKFLKTFKGKKLRLKTFRHKGRNWVSTLIFYKAPHVQTARFGREKSYIESLNMRMLKFGYARLEKSGVPGKYLKYFIESEAQARKNGNGLWGYP